MSAREAGARARGSSPLGRRLFLLSVAGILPLAIMAAAGLNVLVKQQREQSRRTGLELSRSVATAIDAELRSSISALNALATAPSLDRGDLDAFRERARRVLEVEPNWAAVVLADPKGAVLMDTRLPAGAPLAPVADHESLDRVVRTGKAAVGNLARVSTEAWLFAVRVPVGAGEVRYVVTAMVEPEGIRDVLTRQRVPGEWVISIVDANGLRVARSRSHEQNLGGRLSESVQDIVAHGGDEGFGVAYALEGERIYVPYSRIAISGWNAVLGIPTALVEAGVRRSLAVYGGGVLLSIVVGILAALWVAGSINTPMAALRAAAEALGRRETPQPPKTSIVEIRAVGEALTDASRELDELLKKERQARHIAEAADRAKDEFLAVLSHELRTPLNAVFGWSRMLQSGELRDEAAVSNALDVIVRNADVQVRLIDDLLDLSRITTGKIQLDVRPVELELVLHEALDAVRPAADAKDIRMEVLLDEAANVVSGDPGRLQQVVWNLLMNSVKFTARGGAVRVRLKRTGASVQIVVSDTGEGITADVLPYVFERFRQADSSSTRMHGGLGLGLTLVKHLVEMHGGTVTAQSEGTGRGSTFTVTLPIAAGGMISRSPVPARAGVPSGQEALSGAVRLDGLRVLVVDDEAEAVELTRTIVDSAGAEVRTCFSADEALELVRRWRPDVLVADVEMPGHDGYWLIRQVRNLAIEEGGRTPTIALTAYGRPHDRKQTLAAGFSMHVPKPVEPVELTTIIRSVADGSIREGDARPGSPSARVERP